MPVQPDQESLSAFQNCSFQQHLPQYYRKILKEFTKTIRGFAGFNLLFALLLVIEIGGFASLLPVFGRSYLLAFGLGAIFLTAFSYFVLLFYFQAKKPEQITLVCERFIASCNQLTNLPYGASQRHLAVAAALLKLSAYLQDFEWHVYRIPKGLRSMAPLFMRLAAYLHWKDVFNFKQSLLQAAIKEHLQQMQMTPTDLETHASLASTYIALSQIYLEPKEPHPRRAAYHKKQAAFKERFDRASRLALEELQILNHYAPNDPWVHEQLAAGYRSLQLPEEEIREVETLLQLKPQNQEILFRLGTLYFEQEKNAKGLQIYERLKKAGYPEAQKLIEVYTNLSQ